MFDLSEEGKVRRNREARPSNEKKKKKIKEKENNRKNRQDRKRHFSSLPSGQIHSP